MKINLLPVHTIKNLSGIWSTPIEFQRPFGNPSLAVSSDGQMHVVYENNLHAIMYMHRSVAGAWDSAENISKSTDYCWSANIAVNSAGELWIAWLDADIKKMYVSNKNTGDSTWSLPQDLSVSSSSYCYWEPQITAGADSNIYLIWSEEVNGFDDVFYRKKTPGTNWSEAVNVSNTAGVHSIPCDIKVGSDGKVHICWQEGLVGGWANYIGDVEVYYLEIQ